MKLIKAIVIDSNLEVINQLGEFNNLMQQMIIFIFVEL